MILLKKIQEDIDLLTFVVCFVFFTFLLLYLFKYWFVVYIVLFFVSAWSIFKVPQGWRKTRSGVVAYFSSYIISAIIGFAFITV